MNCSAVILLFLTFGNIIDTNCKCSCKCKKENNNNGQKNNLPQKPGLKINLPKKSNSHVNLQVNDLNNHKKEIIVDSKFNEENENINYPNSKRQINKTSNLSNHNLFKNGLESNEFQYENNNSFENDNEKDQNIGGFNNEYHENDNLFLSKFKTDKLKLNNEGEDKNINSINNEELNIEEENSFKKNNIPEINNDNFGIIDNTKKVNNNIFSINDSIKDINNNNFQENEGNSNILINNDLNKLLKNNDNSENISNDLGINYFSLNESINVNTEKNIDIMIDISAEGGISDVVSINNKELESIENNEGIINKKFEYFTRIYKISSEVFEDLFVKIYKIEVRGEFFKSSIIAAVENNSKYYLIVCSSASSKKFKDSFCDSLFSNTNNININYLAIGEELTNFSFLMYNCKNLKYVCMNKLDTKNIGNFGYIFYGCSELRSVDLLNLNVNNVFSVQHMFEGCEKLQSAFLPDFVNVTYVEDMFSGCVNVSNLTFSKKNENIVNEINKGKTECKLSKMAKVIFLN